MDVAGRGIEALLAADVDRLNAKEIANWIFATYRSDCEEKRRRSDRISSDHDLIQQIAREWYSQWDRAVEKEPLLRSTEDRPRLFYIAQNDDEDDESFAAEPASTKPVDISTKFTEHDLYPVLGEFVAKELRCLAMRIDEKRSHNRRGHRGNHWLYPDAAGMIILSGNWHPEVSDLAHSLGSPSVRLCSFEVKKSIHQSNVRETVFQTVSNSSWANFAYLAAETLESKAADELRLLCLAHGIGFIDLNRDEPLESQITIPARFNDQVNFDLLTRLSSENTDAERYLDHVNSFLKTKKKRVQNWDLHPEYRR